MELSRLGKTRYQLAVIVKDFNLRMREGEFICLIGHSGCGKSTGPWILMELSEPIEDRLISWWKGCFGYRG